MRFGGSGSTFDRYIDEAGNQFQPIYKQGSIALKLDDVIKSLGLTANYIKIDVDGIEHLILKGGEKVLMNTKELLIEVNEKFEEQKKNCVKSLKQLGFSLKEKRRSTIFDGTDFASTYNQIWFKQL